jgi:hypothetical protein
MDRHDADRIFGATASSGRKPLHRKATTTPKSASPALKNPLLGEFWIMTHCQVVRRAPMLSRGGLLVESCVGVYQCWKSVSPPVQ